MTIFHLVRHGTYGLAAGRVLAGRTPGHALDATGRREAAAIATTLAARPIGRIVSGPLERATGTAAPLAARLGLPVLIDDALDEVDYGAWTGADWSTLGRDPDWLAWNGWRATAAIPGGETIGAVADRAVGLLHRLSSATADTGGGAEAALFTHAGAEAALFTHADVIRAVLAACLGLASDLSLRIALAPGSRSIVQFEPSAPPLVLGVNLPP